MHQSLVRHSAPPSQPRSSPLALRLERGVLARGPPTAGKTKCSRQTSPFVSLEPNSRRHAAAGLPFGTQPVRVKTAHGIVAHRPPNFVLIVCAPDCIRGPPPAVVVCLDATRNFGPRFRCDNSADHERASTFRDAARALSSSKSPSNPRSASSVSRFESLRMASPAGLTSVASGAPVVLRQSRPP
jgi:hypothetical protein